MKLDLIFITLDLIWDRYGRKYGDEALPVSRILMKSAEELRT
jgi:hypothetical protein